MVAFEVKNDPLVNQATGGNQPDMMPVVQNRYCVGLLPDFRSFRISDSTIFLLH